MIINSQQVHVQIDRGIPGKYPHHDVDRHTSLGAAAPAFCVNYTVVHLYAGAAWFCVNNHGKLVNRCCSDNAVTLCEKGYCQLVNT